MASEDDYKAAALSWRDDVDVLTRLLAKERNEYERRTRQVYDIWHGRFVSARAIIERLNDFLVAINVDAQAYPAPVAERDAIVYCSKTVDSFLHDTKEPQ